MPLQCFFDFFSIHYEEMKNYYFADGNLMREEFLCVSTGKYIEGGHILIYDVAECIQ